MTPTETSRTDRAVRIIRRQRLTIGGLAGLLVLVVGLGQGSTGQDRPSASGPAITHYTAGGDRLYRVWDTGVIEYLTVDLANGSVDGIPGWARIHIDPTLSRDRMGNMIRVPGR
jgi:hypothetical protein